MAPAADKTADGRPVFLIDDIPPVAPPALAVARPAIYYGEEELGYRIVNSGVPEFDYPSGDRTSTPATMATATWCSTAGSSGSCSRGSKSTSAS